MGVLGMIIGVPFFAVLYAMIRRITNKMLQKKGLPLETSKYLDVDYIEENDEFIPKKEIRKNTFFKLRWKKSDSDQKNLEENDSNK